jgi:hypothetical protein
MGRPDAASAIMEAMPIDMAQWCAPWRRQQAGRRASSLPSSMADNGPRPKNRISEMESARRIWV